MTLPQTTVGNASAISGEYGTASEGVLQDSVNDQYLTIMGYGVNANAFNSAPLSTYGTAALGQTAQHGNHYRLDAGGPGRGVDRRQWERGHQHRALQHFQQRQPAQCRNGERLLVLCIRPGPDGRLHQRHLLRDRRRVDGRSYQQQHTSAVTGAASVNPAFGTETRSVEIVNVGGTNTLWASRDFAPSGTPNDSTDIRSFVGPGGGLPTSTTGLTVSRVLQTATSTLGGNFASINLTASLDNGVNNSRNGKFVYLSPEEFFLASPTVMYVADSGEPKSGSSGAAGLGEGGLQKWVLTTAHKALDYDLAESLLFG